MTDGRPTEIVALSHKVHELRPVPGVGRLTELVALSHKGLA